MKKIALYLIFGLSSLFFKAQAQEDYALKNTLNDYLDGGTNQDTARLNKAFSPKCMLRNLSANGQIADMTMAQFMSKARPGQKLNRSTRIVSYSVANNVATAVVEAEYDTFKYVDLLNLFKIGNDWKIVSRLFTRLDKGTEVAAWSSKGGGYTASSAPMNSTPISTSSGNIGTKKTAASKPTPKPTSKSDDGW